MKGARGLNGYMLYYKITIQSQSKKLPTSTYHLSYTHAQQYRDIDYKKLFHPTELSEKGDGANELDGLTPTLCS